ncbi:MAG TPA: tetratricopeptide repeat protein [Longimicrobium sp.]|jgi:tetratricopeptide (TPR) repeat protein/Zn-dependent protease with chaperone function
MLPDRNAAASRLRLRRALLFAALGYGYVAAVLALLCGVLVLSVKLGLGAVGWFALAGLVVYVIIALVVGFAPPAGRLVSREECPELFRAIDRARGEMRAPALDGVFLTHELNASVMERPRFGTVGWTQRYLVLGLPLLYAFPEDELRAILAHALAHLSRQHSRSRRLLARAEATWLVLETRFTRSFRWVSFLFVPFFRWYTPRLEARTQEASRGHEFESDHLAARVSGVAVAARALLRLTLWTVRLERVVWPSVFHRSLERPAPAADDFLGVLDVVREPLARPELERGVRAALRDRTLDSHSHPSLADRLEALGADPAEAERALAAGTGESAAAAFLGPAAPALAAEVGAAWAESAGTLWRQCHADARVWTDDAQPAADATWAHARWAAHCEPPETAIPLLRRAQDRTETRVLLGTLLLQQEDHAAHDEAVRLLEAESRRETASAIHANEALEQYYARVGWPRDLQRCRERRPRLREVAQERSTVSWRDTLRPYPLPPSARDELVATLRGFPEIRNAYLVQKKAREEGEAPAVVLAVEVGTPWYRFRSQGRALEVCGRLLPRIQLPEPLDMIVPVDGAYSLRARLRKLAGAEVYRREGPPAAAAPVSVGWSAPAWYSPRNLLVAGVAGVVLVTGIAAIADPDDAPSTAAEQSAEVGKLRAAATLNPQDSIAARDYAWALVEEERWDEAVPALEAAVRLNPRDVYLRNSLGWVLIQKEEFTEAVSHLRIATVMDSAHVDARHNLAWAHFRQGQYAAAEPEYRRVIRMAPRRANAHAELGSVLLYLNRLDESEKELDEAVRLDASDPWAHLVRGQVKKAVGDLEAAAESYRKAAALDPKAYIWAEVGHIEHLRGKFRESAAAFEMAAKADPKYFEKDAYRREIWKASQAGRMYVPPGS